MLVIPPGISNYLGCLISSEIVHSEKKKPFHPSLHVVFQALSFSWNLFNLVKIS
jgi:hypothetical protein